MHYYELITQSHCSQLVINLMPQILVIFQISWAAFPAIINPPDCKKKVQPCLKMASVKKSCEIKGATKKWLWWYRLMAKNLITTIQVNLYCLIPGISTKFTWIVIKIFAIKLYHHSHFMAAPFISQLFSHWPFFNRVAPFFTFRLFLSGYHFFL